MALRLGWHPSKVTNIEKGKARASEIDLAYGLSEGRCRGKGADHHNDREEHYAVHGRSPRNCDI